MATELNGFAQRHSIEAMARAARSPLQEHHIVINPLRGFSQYLYLRVEKRRATCFGESGDASIRLLG
jgi:hypothetical protein